MVVVGYIGYIYQIQNKAMENIMPGRAGGSRGSAPSAPYLNEARPTTMPGRAFFKTSCLAGPVVAGAPPRVCLI
jgi:hypothetical protein